MALPPFPTPYVFDEIDDNTLLAPRIYNDTMAYIRAQLEAFDETITDNADDVAAELAAIRAGDLDDNAVALEKIEQIAARTLLGNFTGSTADVTENAISADVVTMLGSADNSAIRSNLGVVAKAGDTMTGTLTINTGNLLVARADGIPFIETTGDGQTSAIQLTTYGASTLARILSRRARGSAATPAVVQQNDVSGEWLSQFHTGGGGGFVTAGSLFTRVVAATPGPSDLQSRLELLLCAAGSASPTSAMRVSHASGLELLGPNVVVDGDRVFRNRTYTVGTLPANVAGKRTFVTDALSPVFGSAVSGGGSVTVPVYNSGAGWLVG